MFEPQQASQQTPQPFFTLEVQLTAKHYLLKKGCSFVNEGGGWPGSVRRTAKMQASRLHRLFTLSTVYRQ